MTFTKEVNPRLINTCTAKAMGDTHRSSSFFHKRGAMDSSIHTFSFIHSTGTYFFESYMYLDTRQGADINLCCSLHRVLQEGIKNTMPV